MKTLRFTFFIILLALYSVSVFSQVNGDYRNRYTSGYYGWSTAANWQVLNGTWKTATSPPNSSTNVYIISTTGAYVIDANAACANLIIQSGGKLQYWGNYSANTLTINGSLTINSGGAFTCVANGGYGDCYLYILGNYTNSGTFDMNHWVNPTYCNADLYFSGTGNSTVTLNTGSTNDFFSLFPLKNASTTEVNLVYNGGTFSCQDLTDIGPLYLYQTQMGITPLGTFKISGTGTLANPVFYPEQSAYGINANCKFILNNPNFRVSPGNAYYYGFTLYLPVYGTLNIQQGTMEVGAAGEDDSFLTLESGSTFLMSGGKIGCAGPFISDATHDITYTQSAGDIYVGIAGNAYADQVGIFDLPDPVFTMSGGTIRLCNMQYSSSYLGKPMYNMFSTTPNITGGTLQVGDGVNSPTGTQTFSIAGVTPSISLYKDGTHANNVIMWDNVDCYGSVTIPAGTAYSLYDQDNGDIPYILSVAGSTVTHAGVFYGEVAGSGLGFYGSAAQVFNSTGTFQSAGGYSGISQVELDNSSGLTLTGTQILEIPDMFYLTSGIFNTGSVSVQVDDVGAAVRGTGYLIGTYKKVFPAGTQSFMYDIGTANGYSPVNLAFNNVTNPGTITTTVTQTTHPNVPTPAESLKRYWTMTNSGTTFDYYDAEFTYLAADFNTSLVEATDETTMEWRKWDGSWTLPSVGTRTPGGTADGGSVEATGMTAFSSYTGTRGSAVPPPVADFSGSPTTICAGSSVNFTDLSTNSPTSWSWTFNGGTPSTSTAQNPTNIVYSSPGTYDVSLTATNGGGPDNETKTGYITVQSLSTAPSGINASVNPVCSGSSTTLTVNGGSLGTGASWKWYDASCGSSLVGTGSSVSVSPTVNTTYYVRAEGTCNNTSCASLLITVNSNSTAPTGINASANPICSGSSTTLTVSGGSLGTGAGWQWYSGSCGGTSEGSGSSISVSPTVTTDYFVLAAGTCNTTTCATVTITVNTPSTAPVSVFPSPASICSGSSSDLYVVGGFLGNGASWKWYDAGCGSSLAGTGSSLTVSPTITTTYYVRAEGACNTTSCANGAVTVYAASTAPAAINASANPVCSGNSTTLTVSGGSLGYLADWKWYDANCGTSYVNSGSSISVSPTTATTYYVRAEGQCNTTTCTNLTITIATLSSPALSIFPTEDTICAGGSTDLYSVGGSLGTGASWKWYSADCGTSLAGSGSSVAVSPTVTTTYYLRAEGQCNTTSCVNKAIIVNALSTDPTGASATFNPVCPSSSTTLSVTGGSLGGGADWFWYTASCSGGGFAGNGSTLSVAPTAVTTYFVKAEGACNTTNCSSITITIGTTSTPAINVFPTVNPVCSGSPTDLWTVGGSLGTGADWYWYTVDCGNTFTGTGYSLTVYPTANTTYYVRAEGQCNTTTCFSKLVTVNAAPTAYDVSGGGAYCSGAGNGLPVNLSGSQNGVNYQLMYEATPLWAPIAGNGIALSFANQTAAGNYTIQATNTTTGCQNYMTGSADISIYNCASSTKSVAINRTGLLADSSAILDVSDTVSGVLFPRYTNDQRNALNSPENGLIIYNISTGKINYFYTGNWYEVSSSTLSTGAGSTAITYGTAINTTNAVALPSAMLDVSSSVKGVLIPRTLPGAIYGASKGCIIYNNYTNAINYFNGAAWVALTSSAVSSAYGSGSQTDDGCAVNNNNAKAAASAILDVSASNKGILIPRLTDTQRNRIDPAIGLMIYNISADELQYFDGASWYKMQ